MQGPSASMAPPHSRRHLRATATATVIFLVWFTYDFLAPLPLLSFPKAAWRQAASQSCGDEIELLQQRLCPVGRGPVWAVA
uniref:Uncharacterized protein n=1 Tax=Arundo donax TaxID=35708 RepID=A0A0A9QLG7_ARUDO